MNPYIKELIDDRARLLAFAMNHSGRDKSFSEDILQQSYEKAITHIDQYRPMPNRSVGNWMRAIIINTIRSEARHSKFVVYVPEFWTGDNDDDPLGLTKNESLRTLGDAFVSCHLADIDRVLREQLRPVEIQLLEEYATGMEYEELAAIQQVPIGTVKSRLFRIREKMEKMGGLT